MTGGRQRWPTWKLALARGLAGVACLAFAVAAGAALSSEFFASQGSGRASADVVKVDSFGRGPSTVTVEFLTADGVSVSAEVESEGYERGDAVTVLYDVDNPQRVKIEGDSGQTVAGLFFVFLAAVFGWAAWNPQRAFGPRRR